MRYWHVTKSTLDTLLQSFNGVAVSLLTKQRMNLKCASHLAKGQLIIFYIIEVTQFLNCKITGKLREFQIITEISSPSFVYFGR